VEVAGHLLPVAMENMMSYHGEKRKGWHFFVQFKQLLFNWNGSVLQYMLVEVVITIALSVLAYLIYHRPELLAFMRPEPLDPTGHTILGALLGFLLVFRTQQSYNFFLEGHVLINDLTSLLRALAIDVLGAIPSKGLTPLEDQLVLDLVRHLKLFYFVVVEHVRSRTPKMDWAAAHAMIIKLASASELEECELEFGLPKARREVHPVPHDVSFKGTLPHPATAPGSTAMSSV